MRDIVILGSTGSIGTQALDLVRANPDRFRVVGLTAGGSNRELFEAQVAEFAPAYSGLGEAASTEAAGISMAAASSAAEVWADASAAVRKVKARIPEPIVQLLNTPLGRVLLVIAFASGEQSGC